MRLSKLLLAGGFILLVMVLSGCTTLSLNDDPTTQISDDPFQNLNRKVYAFNYGVDKALLKPIATGYDKVLPRPAKLGVSNFLSNVREPLNIFNNLLQGKYDRALGSSYRFLVNSTFGVVGIFDIASRYDVHETKEDFGQTLAAWGVKPGPYLMLPLLGPSNLRDGVGFVTDNFVVYPNSVLTETTAQSVGLTALRIVDVRVSLLGTDDFLEQQLDPYGFLKLAYEENRLNSIYDGQAPEKEEEDFDF